MKKIRTTTTKKVEKVVTQKLTIGLDLGDRWSWYCVLDEAGEVVLDRKVATTPKAMKEVFSNVTGLCRLFAGQLGFERIAIFRRLTRFPQVPRPGYLTI
jgi:hypothetical protein